MKIFLHYTIWNKEGHIPWICEGIKKSMPKNTVLDFVFDNPTDNGVNQLQIYMNLPANEYGSLRGYKCHYYVSSKKLRWPNTNDAIERFMKSDCDLFLSPQDDMKIQDKFLVENLTKLYQENTEVGLVGMRDGLIGNDFYSSCHSPGGTNTKYLRSGEYQKVDFVNDGPVCLNKRTVQKVGLFDTEYWAHFGDNDYCFRCNDLGLNNFVMGAEVVHEKWGSIEASEVWNQEYSNHDWEVYRRKWPNKQ